MNDEPAHAFFHQVCTDFDKLFQKKLNVPRSEAEFKKQFVGEFKTTERYEKLYKRVEQHYKDSVSTFGPAYLKMHNMLRSWCIENGYSSAELNLMKKDALAHLKLK